MAQPALSASGELLYEALGSITEPDEDNGWALAILCNAFGAMAEPLRALVSDDENGVPGYAHHIFDPDNEPAEWLATTEYFTGTKPLPSVDEAGRRLRIKQTDGRFRGTPGAIKGGARQFLVGPDGTPESATVYLVPRAGGIATSYRVTTLASETPDISLVQAALEEQRPAGFALTYAAVTGGDWTTAISTHADWTDVIGDFATWADFIDNPAHT
jgi:hypothetical protein